MNNNTSPPPPPTADPSLSYVTISPRTNDFSERSWWMVHVDIYDDSCPERQGATALVARCIRRYGWSFNKARRVLKSYQQFLQLKVQFQDWDATRLSPSLLIEQMWMQHILDVENYCHDMMLLCGHVVGYNPDESLDEKGQQNRRKTTRDALNEQYKEKYDEEIWSYSQKLHQKRQGQQKEKVQQRKETLLKREEEDQQKQQLKQLQLKMHQEQLQLQREKQQQQLKQQKQQRLQKDTDTQNNQKEAEKISLLNNDDNKYITSEIFKRKPQSIVVSPAINKKQKSGEDSVVSPLTRGSSASPSTTVSSSTSHKLARRRSCGDDEEEDQQKQRQQEQPKQIQLKMQQEQKIIQPEKKQKLQKDKDSQNNQKEAEKNSLINDDDNNVYMTSEIYKKRLRPRVVSPAISKKQKNGKDSVVSPLTRGSSPSPGTNVSSSTSRQRSRGDDEKVLIRIMNVDGQGTGIQMKPTGKMRKAFRAYAERIEIDRYNLRFYYGRGKERAQIRDNETPISMGIEDGDLIDCMIKE